MATKADLRASHDMLAAIHDRVAAMVKAGKTVEEAVAAKPTQEFDEKVRPRRPAPDQFAQVADTSIVRHASRKVIGIGDLGLGFGIVVISERFL